MFQITIWFRREREKRSFHTDHAHGRCWKKEIQTEVRREEFVMILILDSRERERGDFSRSCLRKKRKRIADDRHACSKSIPPLREKLISIFFS